MCSVLAKTLGGGGTRKTVRGKWHRYLMELDLGDWSERQTYFLGRYHELALQLLMDQAVRPGERVVDVGANIGMLTLHAAARVGPAGVVDAVEPNPTCCARIRAALAQNAIKHVRLHEVALSDNDGMLTLSVLQNHTGNGTLASVTDRSIVTDSVQVPVRIGDELLLHDERPIVLVKMDVEGFEIRALRGLRETLRRFRPIVTTEIIPEWLERAGGSTAELVELMRSLDYRGLGLTTMRGRLGRHSLRLLDFAAAGVPPAGIFDVVWVPRDGPLAGRLS